MVLSSEEYQSNILLFSAEQISFMPFYYVQDVYQKNQLNKIR